MQEKATAIFSDGSKIKDANTVGAACSSYSLSVTEKKSINSVASIFTAECIALNDAVGIAII